MQRQRERVRSQRFTLSRGELNRQLEYIDLFCLVKHRLGALGMAPVISREEHPSYHFAQPLDAPALVLAVVK